MQNFDMSHDGIQSACHLLYSYKIIWKRVILYDKVCHLNVF